MKAELLVRRRIILNDTAFAELVLWRVPRNVRASNHDFKYSLALVSNGVCVVRYDNEAGKGDHKHIGSVETAYAFTTIDMLMADFRADAERWMREHGNL